MFKSVKEFLEAAEKRGIKCIRKAHSVRRTINFSVTCSGLPIVILDELNETPHSVIVYHQIDATTINMNDLNGISGNSLLSYQTR